MTDIEYENITEDYGNIIVSRKNRGLISEEKMWRLIRTLGAWNRKFMQEVSE